MSRIVTIVQARMGSTRLPGKVLLPIGPYPAIIHTLKRCEMAGYPVVLAINICDEGEIVPVVRPHILDSTTIAIIRGDPNDVLGRYLAAAKYAEADIVVRVTGDCPFVQPEMIKAVAESLLRTDCDYVTNTYGPDNERIFARGWDVEAIRFSSLASMCEHVTPFFRRSKWGTVKPLSEMALALAGLPVALDTPEDYAWFQRVAELASVEPPHPTPEELVSLIHQYPELKR